MNQKKHFYFFTLNDFTSVDGGTIRMKGIIDALVDKGYGVTLISNILDKGLFPLTVKHVSINKKLKKNEQRCIQFILGVFPFVFAKILLQRYSNHFKKVFNNNLISGKKIIFFEYFDNAMGYLFKKNHIIDFSINDIHGIAPLEFKLKEKLGLKGKFIKYSKYFASRLIDYKVFKTVDEIIVNSQAMKNYFVGEYPFLKNKKFYIIPDGLSKWLIEQKIDKDLIATVKNKYQINEKTKIVFFAGMFKYFGGVPDLVQAFLRIKDTYQDMKLLLIGDGEDYSIIEKLVKENKVEDKVILLGRVNYGELKSYQTLSDVIICPDKKHPISDMLIHTKYFDSLSSGKIVINCDTPAVREINSNEQLSLTFKASNISDLASKIIYAFDNMDILNDRYRKNTTFIADNYGYDTFVNSLITLDDY
jgi:glycosyltransferase involved in cell wall biosynthesis